MWKVKPYLINNKKLTIYEKKGMAAKNDVTGDELRSKISTTQYRDNWDLIFKKDKTSEENNISDEQEPIKMKDTDL